jgi:hypothetical protein
MSILEIRTRPADVIDLPERSWHSCERREIARRRGEEERAEAFFLCERRRTRRIPRAIARAALMNQSSVDRRVRRTESNSTSGR